MIYNQRLSHFNINIFWLTCFSLFSFNANSIFFSDSRISSWYVLLSARQVSALIGRWLISDIPDIWSISLVSYGIYWMIIWYINFEINTTLALSWMIKYRNIKTKKLFSEFLSQTFNSSQKRNHIKFIDINYHMCWLRVLRRNSVNTSIICNKNNNQYQDLGWGRVKLLACFQKIYNSILYAVWTSDTRTQMCM